MSDLFDKIKIKESLNSLLNDNFSPELGIDSQIYFDEFEKKSSLNLSDEVLLEMLNSYQGFFMLMDTFVGVHKSDEHSTESKEKFFDDVLGMVMRKQYKYFKEHK